MKRFDTIAAGTPVLVKFDGREDRIEFALFLGVEGSGEDRKAKFVQADGTRSFEWEAYRFNGGWAYGSSAGTLSLVGILGEPSITTYSNGDKQATFNL